MDVKKKVHESSTTQKSVVESKETFSTHSNGWGRIGIRGMEHFWRISKLNQKSKDGMFHSQDFPQPPKFST